MFSNKLNFKQEFERRLVEKYGKEPRESHITERYDVLGRMVRDYAGYDWRNTRETILKDDDKQLIYFSMEFLIGRLLVNNMQNLGIYEVAKEGLADFDINIHDLEEMETDAGLGNGGLGRLAACFMDSIASLGYPGHGNCIRYEYGFFRQKFVNGKQTELPDIWLTNGSVWEVRKPKHAVEVKFYGNAETYLKPNGEYAVRLVNPLCVKAMPYDVSIVGYRNHVANTLRLWSAEPSEENLPKNQAFEDYLSTLKEICHGLYPDDSTEHGKILRLRQQYFLVSAGLQSALRGHKRRHGTIDDFADKHVFQLNDTHPILAIPEMMRILMDDYGFGWDKSWKMVSKCMAYTNHTVMAEALEKWPVQYVQQLIPRVYMIIEEINRRFNMYLVKNKVDSNKSWKMQIIRDGMVYMANLGVYASFSVNGVAALHTEILEKDTFKEFYELFPEKFNNKTNGVTHRRWLLYSNPGLSKLITSKIGGEWITDMDKIEKLKEFADSKELQKQILAVKKDNKVEFAKYVKKHYGVDIDPKSIYDVQIKRLHAYKRQLMNCFNIMRLYQKIKNDSSFTMTPRTFIFGAKAAPSYYFAKKVIELINEVAYVCNNDPDVSKYVKVVFVENYGVTLAENIIPAADVSEQISTAGKEASGTSNMKFMMNGAITLGTLDGANVEISERVGADNCVIFGMKADEVAQHNLARDYSPWHIYNSDSELKEVVDSLLTGPWAGGHEDRFKPIFDELMNKNDEYYVLKDFASYVEAQNKIEALYNDKNAWAKMCIINIAMSGYFSSDRTIKQYVNEIWHIDKLVF